MNHEATVVKEPTESELRFIAVWAHDLGTFLYRNDPRLDQTYREHVALLELESCADDCPIPAQNAHVRAVWCWNFLAGWQTRAWDDEREIPPTINVGDYQPSQSQRWKGWVSPFAHLQGSAPTAPLPFSPIEQQMVAAYARWVGGQSATPYASRSQVHHAIGRFLRESPLLAPYAQIPGVAHFVRVAFIDGWRSALAGSRPEAPSGWEPKARKLDGPTH